MNSDLWKIEIFSLLFVPSQPPAGKIDRPFRKILLISLPSAPPPPFTPNMISLSFFLPPGHFRFATSRLDIRARLSRCWRTFPSGPKSLPLPLKQPPSLSRHLWHEQKNLLALMNGKRYCIAESEFLLLLPRSILCQNT